METVPLMKEIVDYYSGPDRVTAKQQQQELERVAKTLPESAPNSVKRFTERAVLSLQVKYYQTFVCFFFFFGLRVRLYSSALRTCWRLPNIYLF